MNIEAQLRLSYYKEIADINEKHNVKLVQHTETGKIFVLKKLDLYNKHVFKCISENMFFGIPKIIELIEFENILYVVEEYISGNTLREIIDEKGKITEKDAANYIIQLCNILSPFHKMTPSIIHRDLKPSNLILDFNNNIKLIDFNSAKEISLNRKEDTVLMGTVGYAAPEQYGFSQSTASADIFAIGILLNELLTGHLPKDVSYKGPLEHIIKKCTQLDPKNRYSSVNDISKAIKKTMYIKNGTLNTGILPPGFRSKNPAIIIPAILWYLFILLMGMSLDIKDCNSNLELIMNRIAFILLFLCETFFIGNYKNIWAYIPFASSKNIFIKTISIFIYSIILSFIIIFILSIITLLFS